ncbi:MAG: hypothetical protein DWQ10_08255 [Calditrichaeota bacterium]|nr:MAG: hypothetical protein DWQ10_08255 [Calditrichota bacterium]
MAGRTQGKASNSAFDYFLIILYTSTITILLFYLYDGLSFYFTPFIERAHHTDYRNLRPAGFRGHGFGIIGTAMLLLLFLYSARKRIAIFQNFGHVAKWLKIHIYFGLMGPLFIILHSTFKVNGLISVSFWSMIAVAMSGIWGKYLYLKIPHNMLGRALSFDEMSQKRILLDRHLKKRFNMPDKFITQIEQITQHRELETVSSLRILLDLIKNDLTRRSKLKKFADEYARTASLQEEEKRYLLQLIQTKGKMDSEAFFWNRIHSLFHYWHVIHKPFAYIMLLIMVVHVVVAILMGYTWL